MKIKFLFRVVLQDTQSSKNKIEIISNVPDGICGKIVSKNRDDTDTRRDAHPLGSVTAHPPGAASALFRCRRDVRHPSFGGGARLQRASTPPAVVRIERDSSVITEPRDQIR